MKVYHEPHGYIFRKLTGEEGISYVSVPDDQVTLADRTLLVRHGDIESGECGYYPLYLIYRDEEFRQVKAQSVGKRPPSVGWVAHVQFKLDSVGLLPLSESW